MFHFELKTAWADDKRLLPFDQLLGKKVTVEISSHQAQTLLQRHRQQDDAGRQRDEDFTLLHAGGGAAVLAARREAAQPHLPARHRPGHPEEAAHRHWTCRLQIDGTFEQREYCVQYRETDFAFASRLMEEEGIYYFFKHSAGGHQMVLANTPQSHPAVPYLPTAIWEDDRTLHARKSASSTGARARRSAPASSRSWDHKFEMPDKHLEAEKTIMDTVTVGTVTHKLKVANNESLELYDYPGGYASRFDGINKSGGEQPAVAPAHLQDNKRTVEIRMQEEALCSLLIRGQGAHAGFTAGHTFDLTQPLLRQRQVRAHQRGARCRAAAGRGRSGGGYSSTTTVSPASPRRCPSGPRA